MTEDPRLIELKQIGVPRWMVEIAKELGVDIALTVWQKLNEASLDDKNRVGVPSWSTYLRYQRNRFISALTDEGLQAETIHQRVSDELCEQLSLPHIKRIMGRHQNG